MSKLKVKKNEDGKYGFVDYAGNWVIEPKLLKAFVWNYYCPLKNFEYE